VEDAGFVLDVVVVVFFLSTTEGVFKPDAAGALSCFLTAAEFLVFGSLTCSSRAFTLVTLDVSDD
jgi:hypothetical protein